MSEKEQEMAYVLVVSHLDAERGVHEENRAAFGSEEKAEEFKQSELMASERPHARVEPLPFH